MPARRNDTVSDDDEYPNSGSEYSDYGSDDDGDDGEFENSEEEYAKSQSGGESEDESDNNQLGEDSSTIDIDPDDEMDPNEDGIYDPVTENEEESDHEDDPELGDAGGDSGSDIEGLSSDGEAIDEDDGSIETSEPDESNESNESNEPNESGDSRSCYMRTLSKDGHVLDQDSSNMYGRMEYVKVDDMDRISGNDMTYYEMVRIIGTRAQQFNLGAKPLVKGVEHLHSAKMAYVELMAKMTPYIIRRHMPGKRYEEWRIDELNIVHEITDEFFVPENFNWESLRRA